MLKNKVIKFLFVYAIILSVIDVFFIYNWFLPISYNRRILVIFVGDIFFVFILIYIIELIISIIYIKNYITLKNIRKIIPQIIISLLYLLLFLYSIHDDFNIKLFTVLVQIYKFFEIPWGLCAFLAAISLFFSHLIITGYLGNHKIAIFWKIMSSLTSFLMLFLTLGLAGSKL